MKDYIVAKRKSSISGFYDDLIRKHVTAQRVGLFVLFVLFILALVGFAQIELINNPEVYQEMTAKGQNPYFESLYWIVTTMTTVGYGDISPITITGKLLAIVVMILGVSTLGLIATQVVSVIVSTNLGALLGVNKVHGRVDYLICGWNEVSNATLKELMKEKHRIVVVDIERREELVKLDNVNFIKGSPTEKVTLENANLKDTGTVILAMDKDSDVILAIHVIREINPYVNIVAKINNHDDILLAKNAGADHIVGPSVIGGKLLWEAFSQPSVSNWLVNLISAETDFGFFEYDVTKTSPIVGKKIGTLRNKLSGKAKLISVDTDAGLEKVPSDDLEIKEGNKLILIINKEKFRGIE